MATQVESIKWVPGTNFIVDGFAFTSPKCQHYFLTHAHSDHTIGLRKSFSAGLIYCSHVTARLLIHDMGVRSEVVRPLEVGVPVVIAGVRVTPLDANHCPGSVMFLFEVPVRDKDKDRGRGRAGESGSGAGRQQAAGALGVKSEETASVKAEVADAVAAAVLVKAEPGVAALGIQEEKKETVVSPAAELGVAWAAAAGQQVQEAQKAQGAGSCQRIAGGAFTADGEGDEDEDEAARGAELENGCQQLMALAAADADRDAAADGAHQGWGPAAEKPQGLPGLDAPLTEPSGCAAGPLAAGAEVAGKPSPSGTIGAGASGSGGRPGDWCGGVPTHNVLHTGDMRWQRWMRDQPGLAGVRVDTLFLDTTYALPRHRLPPQEEAIAMMVQAMREAQAEEPATLFVVAAYHIGKERAFLGAAQQLGTKVWATPDKRKVLALLGLAPELAELLVEQPEEADIHVGGWGLRHEDLQAYMASHKGSRWKRVVGIRPTGWTFRRKGGVSVWREGEVAILGVPYSEHSSWTDLCDAVSQLRPQRVVPTVNAATPAHRRSLVDRFAHLMDLSTDRSRLDVYLARAAELQRIKSEAGEPPASAGTCAATGAAPGAAAVCRVDLAAVDVGEQERILAQVQEQHRRRQEMQQRRAQLQQAQQERRRSAAQERKGKARKRGRAEDGSPAEEVAEAEAEASSSGRHSGEDVTAMGSAACSQQRPQRRRQSSSVPPRGSHDGRTPIPAAASAAERAPAPLARRNSCGPAAGGACVVDLTIDSDYEADEQEDQQDQERIASRAGLSSGGRGTAAAHGSIRRFLATRDVAQDSREKH